MIRSAQAERRAAPALTDRLILAGQGHQCVLFLMIQLERRPDHAVER